MDNSSTSYPKAPQVCREMCSYMENIGASGGRGVYPAAIEADMLLYTFRCELSSYIGLSHPDRLIFTKGATESLNIVLRGLFKRGDRVLVSGYEHNSVMRPLFDIGAEVLIMDSENFISIPNVPDVAGVVMTAASNVTGAIQPLEKMGELCRRRNIPFIVDGAQLIGAHEINMERMNISAMCFGAHKYMLGPQGIGALAMSDEISRIIPPLNFGGTGIDSANPSMPQQCPEKFEAGTLNMMAIAGWRAAVKYLNSEKNAHQKLMDTLITKMSDGLSLIDGITVYGPKNTEDRVGVFSVDFLGLDNGECTYRLSENFGISTRSGLHCSPLAHRTLGTEKKGLVRFSLSVFTSENDVDSVLDAVKTISL